MGPLQVPLRSLDRAEPKPQPEVRGRDGRTKGACLQFPDATRAAGREADCLGRTAGGGLPVCYGLAREGRD